MNYDFLIVGAGMFGMVCAHQLVSSGKTCLIIDKRDHIGGNCYSIDIDGIDVHLYGPHIFHTNDRYIWDYFCSIDAIYPYNHRVKVKYKDKLYSFPINMFTLYQLYGVTTPSEARELIESKQTHIVSHSPSMEEYIIANTNQEIYDIFIKGYTTKQWGIPPSELPADIIKRIPIRYTYDDGYFNNGMYQGIPANGWHHWFQKLALLITAKDSSRIQLNTNFLENKIELCSLAEKIIYTGMIDEYFDYAYGNLEYRSLYFETDNLHISDYQGCSIMNYTDESIPYTRIVEHKHFLPLNSIENRTIITKEFPKKFDGKNIPMYPIGNRKNTDILDKYRILSNKQRNIIFAGRLGKYTYYDMCDVIASAIKTTRSMIK